MGGKDGGNFSSSPQHEHLTLRMPDGNAFSLCPCMHVCPCPVWEREGGRAPWGMEVLPPAVSAVVRSYHSIRLLGAGSSFHCFLRLQAISTISDKKNSPGSFAEIPMLCCHLNVSSGGHTSRLITESDDRTQQKSDSYRLGPAPRQELKCTPICQVQSRPKPLLAWRRAGQTSFRLPCLP